MTHPFFYKLSFLIITLLIFFSNPESTLAATFSLSPSTGTKNTNQEFQLELGIDTQGQSIIAAGAVIRINPSTLDYVSSTNGGFFSSIQSHFENDLLRVGGVITSTESPKSGTGKVATLTFKGKSAGNSNIVFVCGEDGGSTISKVNPTTNSPYTQNIITCTQLTNAQYTISGSGGGGNPGGGNPGGGGDVPPTGPYSSPVPGTPTCDVCGKCGNSPEPPNYGSCQQCVSGGSSWTAVGCVPTNAAGFVQSLLRVVVPLVGGLAFLGLLGGGFLLATSSGDPIRISQGKQLLFGSIGAILIVVFAIFILNFVGMNLLGIPGF